MKKNIYKYIQQASLLFMRSMLIFTVFVGWSGFLCPEMAFENGVAKAYTTENKEREGMNGYELFEELLNAKPEQIHVKSRLAEIIFYFIS